MIVKFIIYQVKDIKKLKITVFFLLIIITKENSLKNTKFKQPTISQKINKKIKCKVQFY